MIDGSKIISPSIKVIGAIKSTLLKVTEYIRSLEGGEGR